jgi:hypothetical protein
MACLLLWLLAAPITPARDDSPQEESTAPRWIEATLLAIDTADARATYRIEANGDVKTSGVGSGACLERLAKLKVGERIMLKFRQADAGEDVLVEDVKKKKGHKWLLIVIAAPLAILIGAVVVNGILGGVSRE